MYISFYISYISDIHRKPLSFVLMVTNVCTESLNRVQWCQLEILYLNVRRSGHYHALISMTSSLLTGKPISSELKPGSDDLSQRLSLMIFTADILDLEKYNIKWRLADSDFLGDAFILSQLFYLGKLALLKNWIMDVHLLLLEKEPKTLMRKQWYYYILKYFNNLFYIWHF